MLERTVGHNGLVLRSLYHQTLGNNSISEQTGPGLGLRRLISVLLGSVNGPENNNDLQPRQLHGERNL